jgi:hypothetical protein
MESTNEPNGGSDSSRCSTVTPTEAWNELYWAYNVPLQMWGDAETGWRVVNYMPRKESCLSLEERVTKEEMPQFCRNAAIRLRQLAVLFEAMADGKIDIIYYPDEPLEDAIKETNERRNEEL